MCTMLPVLYKVSITSFNSIVSFFFREALFFGISAVVAASVSVFFFAAHAIEPLNMLGRKGCSFENNRLAWIFGNAGFIEMSAMVHGILISSHPADSERLRSAGLQVCVDGKTVDLE